MPTGARNLYDSLVSDLAVAFGRAVRIERARRGWDQGILSERAGLNRGYISSIERGSRNPTLDVVARIAVAFGMEPWELVRAAGQEETAAQRSAPVVDHTALPGR